MSRKWDVVEVLRHARHDWMNDLQLIKGNLNLDRIDRAKQVIEEMVLAAQNESKLSNLKLPLLTEWILTYNWSGSMIKLDFEILDCTADHGLDDQGLVSWCTRFVDELVQCVSGNGENQLSILLHITKDAPRFIFDFTGILSHAGAMKEWLENERRNGTNISIEQIEEEVLVFHVAL